PAAVGGEADGDLDDLIRVDADGVLEPALVLVDRVVELVVRVALDRDGRGEVSVADAAVGYLVPNRAARQDLERIEMDVDRVGVPGPVDHLSAFVVGHDRKEG